MSRINIELNYLNFLEIELFVNDNEKQFINYFRNYWINKRLELFNYYNLIHDIIKLKNAFIKKKGNKKSETDLVSKIKSLEKVFLTNNICESIHSHISKFIENKNISKILFKDAINYIINHYKYNLKKCIRRDFITRTLIVICEKFNLNETPKIITYDEFKKELEFTISLMTGQVKINAINELINSLDYIHDNDIDIIEESNNILENNNGDNIGDDISISSILSDDNIEDLSFNNNEFIDKAKIELDDSFSFNLGNSSDNENKEKDNNEKKFDIDEIEKDRGFLTLFTFGNKINQDIKKVLNI